MKQNQIGFFKEKNRRPAPEDLPRLLQRLRERGSWVLVKELGFSRLGFRDKVKVSEYVKEFKLGFRGLGIMD